MEAVHVYNLITLIVALLVDYIFIKVNSRKRVFTKGETAFWCIAIIIWTFWIYYMIRGLLKISF